MLEKLISFASLFDSAELKRGCKFSAGSRRGLPRTKSCASYVVGNLINPYVDDFKRSAREKFILLLVECTTF